jgi:zinc D-Ala-D-Ala carboxypeptidase
MSNTKWPHFSRKELTCQCGCDHMEMDPEFMDRLESLRTIFDRPMRITSAFRCPNHNAQVSSTGFTGPHTTGKSVDVAVSGQQAHDLLALAIHHNFTGLGISQRGPHNKRFIHLDTITQGPGRPRPRVWSY